MHKDLRILTAAIVIAILHSSLGSAADWPQFLGPHRNGISSETGLIDSFPNSGPPLLWKVSGGVGMSGLAVNQGRVLTAVEADGKQCVLALDATSGERLWQTAIAAAYRNSMGDGTRATPTIAGEHAFLLSGEGILFALDVRDGSVLWEQPLIDRLGGKAADYGMACSPLVVGDYVVTAIGAPQAAVVAVSAETGEIAWQTGDETGGYSSPVVLNVAGQQQIVAFTGSALLGLEPTTGKQLWRYPFKTDFGCNTATPVAVDRGIFISAGENHGSVLLTIDTANDGFVAREAWSSLAAASTLRAEWQTPLVVGSRLYGFDNVGAAGPVTHLTCIDSTSGERLWQKTRFGKGNAILADGKLWISTLDGQLVLVEATPTAYQERSRADVGIATRQAPALADGRLYLRDNASIVCFDVSTHPPQ